MTATASTCDESPPLDRSVSKPLRKWVVASVGPVATAIEKIRPVAVAARVSIAATRGRQTIDCTQQTARSISWRTDSEFVPPSRQELRTRGASGHDKACRRGASSEIRRVNNKHDPNFSVAYRTRTTCSACSISKTHQHAHRNDDTQKHNGHRAKRARPMQTLECNRWKLVVHGAGPLVVRWCRVCWCRKGCETRPDHGPRPPTEPSPTSRNPTTVS